MSTFSERRHDRRTAEADLTASLESAVFEYLARGWSLIPLSGKLPAIPTWKEFQSRRPAAEEIESWFAARVQRPTGVGIVTGKLSGLVVVDCDSTEDAAYWQERFSSSPLIVETGRTGVHLYYAMPDAAEVRNRAGVFGRKIDIRGEGGYATAPPSLHPNGRRYAWRGSDACKSLPVFDDRWLIDSIRRPFLLSSSKQTGQVRNAVAYISRIHAVSGQGGHNATFRAACKLRDAGLLEEEALAVLSDWNDTNASPPWSEAELAHKIRSAFNAPTK